MVIFYKNQKMEDVLTDPLLINRYYGKVARNLMIRLSELRAANNLSEVPIVPPPRRHKLTGKYKGCWGVNISKNQRIILRPRGDFDEKDLTTIINIEIIEIEDYH